MLLTINSTTGYRNTEKEKYSSNINHSVSSCKKVGEELKNVAFEASLFICLDYLKWKV